MPLDDTNVALDAREMCLLRLTTTDVAAEVKNKGKDQLVVLAMYYLTINTKLPIRINSSLN